MMCAAESFTFMGYVLGIRGMYWEKTNQDGMYWEDYSSFSAHSADLKPTST